MSHPIRKNLKYLIILATFLIVVVFSYIKYLDIFNHVQHDQETKLKSISKHTEYRFAERELILDILIEQILTQDLLDKPQAITKLLDYQLDHRADLGGLMVSNTQGKVIAASHNLDINKIPVLSEHPRTAEDFKFALTQSRMVIGRNYYFKPLDGWVVPFRKAIRKDGKVVAVISTGMTVKNIHNEIDTSFLTDNVVRIINFDNFYRIYSSSQTPENYHKVYGLPVEPKITNNVKSILTDKYGIDAFNINQQNSYQPLQVEGPNVHGQDTIANIMYLPSYNYWVSVERTKQSFYSYVASELVTYLLFFLVISSLLIFFLNKLNKKELDIIETLEHKAEHDQLTGLPNRYYLENHFKQQLNKAESSISLLFIDLDNFKNVNDTFGHHIGDKLLLQVAERLEQLLKYKSDIVRFGGDEFVVLLKDKHIYDTELAEQIIQTISVSYIIDQLNFTIGASIGLCRTSVDKADLNTMLSQADIAMYEAKKRKNSIEVFNTDLQQQSLKHAQMENYLRQAIIHNEIYMNYQPQIDRDGQLYGVECLVRWQNKELGFVPPNEFIKVAEDIGLMPELGFYIIKTSLDEMAALQKEFNQPFQVSINISLKQFLQNRFFERFIDIAQQSGINLKNITIEVTESLFIEDLDFILGILSSFRQKGISISLDDFGTGFSSLSLLRQLPIQELKIDKAFVDDILTDDKDASLINNIIQIANDLGMYTVAEGVETEEQYLKLTDYGCNLYQGYYFSKPLAFENLKSHLNDSSFVKNKN